MSQDLATLDAVRDAVSHGELNDADLANIAGGIFPAHAKELIHFDIQGWIKAGKKDVDKKIRTGLFMTAMGFDKKTKLVDAQSALAALRSSYKLYDPDGSKGRNA